MSFCISIRNRQRRMAVDLSRLKAVSARLSAELWRNLEHKPPKHLTEKMIKALHMRGSLSLTLVSNRQIRQLNYRWRGKDMATDVISFPLADTPPPAGLPWEIGEVVISVEKAHNQAEELGHSLERELAFLFVHGLLHVLGFDHIKPVEEKEMITRQKEILAAAGYRLKTL